MCLRTAEVNIEHNNRDTYTNQSQKNERKKNEIKIGRSQIGEEKKMKKKHTWILYIFIWCAKYDRKLSSVFLSISHLISWTD